MDVNKIIDVIALGELLIDFTENGTSDQGNPLLEANPGGAPCNVLAMLQKLGHKTAFIGKVGRDSFGEMLAETIKMLGIDTQGLMYDEKVHTTLAFVHSSADGDRNFSFYRNPGADVMLSADEVNENLIKEAKIFHFGTLSMTHETVELATQKAIRLAKENKMIISFDPNLRPPLWNNLDDAKAKMQFGMQNCDILKISDNEIEFYTGTSDIDDGIRQIIEEFQIPLVCATLGKEGSIAYYKGKKIVAAPFILENTIETTGAGDTFMGCVLSYVLNNGLENLSDIQLQEMLQFANAAAALITTKRGALKVMPDVESIDSLLKCVFINQARGYHLVNP